MVSVRIVSREDERTICSQSHNQLAEELNWSAGGLTMLFLKTENR